MSPFATLVLDEICVIVVSVNVMQVKIAVVFSVFLNNK